jgi:hypothetical protein
MATKVSYTNLKLKLNKDVNTINFNDNVIEILKYLPVNDKYDLIMVTLQKSFEDGIYNPIKLDMYFHLFLIYLYTNINFTDKQKEDEAKLYDALKSSGLLDEILKNIETQEYNDLYEYLQEALSLQQEYKQSFVNLLSTFIDNVPQQMEEAMKIVDGFDPEKFGAVTDFAKALNGGRSI